MARVLGSSADFCFMLAQEVADALASSVPIVLASDGCDVVAVIADSGESLADFRAVAARATEGAL